jgi:hypothetical protein
MSTSVRHAQKRDVTAREVRGLADRIASDIEALAGRAGAQREMVLKMLAHQTARRMTEIQPGLHWVMAIASLDLHTPGNVTGPRPTVGESPSSRPAEV